MESQHNDEATQAGRQGLELAGQEVLAQLREWVLSVAMRI